MTATTLTYNPFDPAMRENPYPVYARLRAEDPVHLSPMGFWVLTRHADVKAVIAERSMTVNFQLLQSLLRGPEVLNDPVMRLLEPGIGFLDEPRHSPVRRLFSSAFPASRAAALRASMEAKAAELIDAHAGDRAMDLINDLALPLPAHVIGELLGLPAADHTMIADDALAVWGMLEPAPSTPAQINAANAAAERLGRYFTDQIRSRQKQPTDDLISEIVAKADSGRHGEIGEFDLVANLVMLYIAGHDTTTSSTGLALLHLHRHHEQWKTLQAEPHLVPNAVEECLRFDPPGQALVRFTTQPLLLGDQLIPTDALIMANLGAAGRDPVKYPLPDDLDVRRVVDDPLVFGFGRHACIGQHLARLEVEIVLTALLHRCPNLTLDTLLPEWRDNIQFRALKSLPAHW